VRHAFDFQAGLAELDTGHSRKPIVLRAATADHHAVMHTLTFIRETTAILAECYTLA